MGDSLGKGTGANLEHIGASVVLHASRDGCNHELLAIWNCQLGRGGKREGGRGNFAARHVGGDPASVGRHDGAGEGEEVVKRASIGVWGGLIGGA